MVVVIVRWSLFGGGRWLSFDFIYNIFFFWDFKAENSDQILH